jgi:putative peptidoglycan lipid II flippase
MTQQNKERSDNVIRSAGVVGGFTMLSRALGLARDVLMAGFFGTSLYMSAFVVAFTIPNLFRRLFGEGALSASFIPVFVESRRKDGDGGAWQMADRVISMLAVVLMGIVALGLIVLSLLLLRGGYSEKTTMILDMLRVMLPYALFICLAALSMAILNSFRHFAVPAATPCLLNIIWIVAVAVICPRISEDLAVRIHVVAWAVLVAGVVQLAAQVPVLMRYGYRPRVSLDWRDERVVRMLRLMLPAALGLAVTQVNVLIDRVLAAWIGDWAPAALFFSERMIYFPLGVFATALGTVLLPTFSHHAADQDHARMKATMNHALRNLLFLMVPAAMGLFVLAGPIIRMIFQWGQFSGESTLLTARALRFYAPGLVVFSLAKVFVPAFYAQQDTRTPVLVGVCTVVLNVILNLTFVLTFPLYYRHAGLALGTVLAETFYAIVLAVILHKRLGSPGWIKIVASLVRTVLLAVVMGAAIWWGFPVLERVVCCPGCPEKILQILRVIIAIGVGGGLYVLCACVVRATELRELVRSFRS